MKIIKLSAQNFKKLTAVEITPEGNVITLTGDNGAGKSSVLDAIVAALAGKGGIGPIPVRQGADRGEIVCTLPGLTVTRRFNASGGSTLTVRDADNNPVRSPQAALDCLLSNLAFDPLEFSRMKPLEQAESLRKLVGLDFTALNKKRADLYDARHKVNQQIDLMKKQAEAFRTPAGVDDTNLPAQPVSIADLMARLTEAEAHNFTNQAIAKARVELRQRVTEAEGIAADAKKSVEEALEQIRQWQVILEQRRAGYHEAETNAAKVKAELEQHAAVEIKDPISLVPLKDAIVNAEALNKRIETRQRWEKLTEEVKPLVTESENMTRQMEELDREKVQALNSVKVPLPGLSFDEAGVYYNGIPFSQVSDGEKLRISVAIGMALNPTLKVIFVRDGSLLDQSGLKLIADLAATNDYQVWIEDARSTDPGALVIEDGHIKQ